MLDGPKVRLTMVNLKGAKFWPSFKFLAVQNYGPQSQFWTVQNYSQQTNFGRFKIQPITVILDGPKLHPRIVNLGSLVQFKFYQRNLISPKGQLHTIEMNYVQMYLCEPSNGMEIQNFDPQP